MALFSNKFGLEATGIKIATMQFYIPYQKFFNEKLKIKPIRYKIALVHNPASAFDFEYDEDIGKN